MKYSKPVFKIFAIFMKFLIVNLSGIKNLVMILLFNQFSLSSYYFFSHEWWEICDLICFSLQASDNVDTHFICFTCVDGKSVALSSPLPMQVQ